MHRLQSKIGFLAPNIILKTYSNHATDLLGHGCVTKDKIIYLLGGFGGRLLGGRKALSSCEYVDISNGVR